MSLEEDIFPKAFRHKMRSYDRRYGYMNYGMLNDDGGVNENDISYVICYPERFALMLWTGMADMNGVEIYEGDIVVPTWGSELLYEIKWCRGGYDNILAFHPIRKDGYHANHYYGGWSGYDFKIIGNIYENPELMKND